ncbi:hypothetical protein GCM10023079_51070 [Streptomyces chitinivorans]
MIVERAYAHVESYDDGQWPWSLPCVRTLLTDGLRFTAPVTFLVGEHGLRRTAWDALALVDHWRRYLAGPGAYLRHVLD